MNDNFFAEFAPSPPPDFQTQTPLEARLAALKASNIPTSGSFLQGALQGGGQNWYDRIAAMSAASPFQEEGQAYGPGNSAIGAGRLLGENLLPKLFGTGGTQAYDKAFDEQRAESELFNKAHPGAYGLGEITGGVGAGLALPVAEPLALAKGGSTIANAARTLGNLGTTGAVYGALNSTGAAPTSADMPRAAAEGALTGGATTAGIGGTLGLLGKLFGRVVGHIGATFRPEAAGEKLVQDRLQQGGADPQALADQVAAMHAAGQTDYTLADAAQDKLGGLPGSISRQPGEGRAPTSEFLNERQYGNGLDTGARVRNDQAVADYLGGSNGDTGSLAAEKAITERQKTASKPLYAAAANDPITMNDTLAQLIPRLQESGAYDKASHYVKLGGGQVDLSTLEPWQAMKEALDDKIGKLYDSGQPKLAGRMRTISDDLRSELYNQSDNYKQANAVWKSDADMKDALALGSKFADPSYTREQLASDFNDLSPGEQNMFRLGAGNSLRETIARAPGTNGLPDAVVKGTALGQKLKIIAPDEDSHALFAQRMQAESDMARTTRQALGGPDTARRIAEDQGSASDVGQSIKLGAAAVLGHPHWLIREAVGYVKNVDPAMRGAVLNEARKIILNPDPVAVQQFAAKMHDIGAPPETTSKILGLVSRAPQSLQGAPGASGSIRAMTPAEMQQGEPDQKQAEPAVPATWRLARHKNGGPLVLHNPNTGQMQPYAAGQ